MGKTGKGRFSRDRMSRKRLPWRPLFPHMYSNGLYAIELEAGEDEEKPGLWAVITNARRVKTIRGTREQVQAAVDKMKVP